MQRRQHSPERSWHPAEWKLHFQKFLSRSKNFGTQGRLPPAQIVHPLFLCPQPLYPPSYLSRLYSLTLYTKTSAAMAMHLAKQRRMRMEGVDNGFAEANPISAVAARGKRSTSFDPARYLQVRGWAGHGAALDGHGGRGLRKPILIPHKRDNKGLGQNRDRAVEWWDCLFEVSPEPAAAGQKKKSADPPLSYLLDRRVPRH